MNGPGHYEAAETLLELAVETHDGRPGNTCLARAQVHATLALAAAVAMSQCGTLPLRDADAWADTASTEHWDAVLEAAERGGA
jgi:hypothetical protein